jgi:regulator of replication initiation timing
MVGISGSFDLAGKLTYMAGAEQAVYKIKPQKFKLVKEINKINTINPKIKVSENKKIRLTNTKLKGVICNRKVIFNNKKNNYEVELQLISNKKGAYSIIEIIPKGFDFLETDLQGAKIRKQSNLVQYMWKNTSFNEGIKIKYQLTPKENNKNKPSFSGKLSFLQNGNIFNMPILEEKK